LATTIPAILSIILYVTALRNGFAYDDIPIIPANDWVRRGMVLTQALHLPYWPGGTLYRPLTSFLYGVEWIAGHGSPMVFHACNLLWYALGTALVARVALRWWSPAAAATAATLFAVQPVHVEAVANVVGSAELLAGAALLGVALLASRSHAPPPTTHDHAIGLSRTERRTDFRLIAIGILSAVALAAKETGAVAPAIAWGAASLDAAADPSAPHAAPGLSRPALRAAFAAFLGIAVLLGLRWLVLGTLAGDHPHPAFLFPPGRALPLALATIPYAISLIIAPQLPRIDYSPTSAAIAHPNPLLVAGGLVAVATACAAALIHARRPSRWTFAALFAAATFAPVSNLVLHTGVVLADRTLYAPSMGVALLLGGALVAITRYASADRHGVARPHWRRTARDVAWIGAGFIIVIGLRDTIDTIPIWHDNVSVFTAMRDRSPTSYRGYYLLNKERRATGPSRAAHSDYITAIALFSGDASLLYDAGVNAAALGDTSDALRWLRASVDRSPADLRSRTALVLLDLRAGESAPARALLRDGLTLDPDQHAWRKMLDSLDRAASPALPVGE
jgi:hypothetical protein